jgi:hypothetical protein
MAERGGANNIYLFFSKDRKISSNQIFDEYHPILMVTVTQLSKTQ